MKDDTISRQAAIDALDEAKTTMMLVIDLLSEDVKNEESKIQIETIYATVDSVKQILRKLPPAHLEKFSKVLQDMMDEDYYLYCHSGYSHLDEKDWEWLIK